MFNLSLVQGQDVLIILTAISAFASLCTLTAVRVLITAQKKKD